MLCVNTPATVCDSLVASLLIRYARDSSFDSSTTKHFLQSKRQLKLRLSHDSLEKPWNSNQSEWLNFVHEIDFNSERKLRDNFPTKLYVCNARRV